MDGVDKSAFERIEQAANELYEESNHERFPTVDTVRRRAKVDMNTASLVMRAWRKKQLSKALDIETVEVPKELSEVFAHSIKSVWEQAQAIANESLKIAQQSWEKERQEAEDLASEISNAFDEQAARLEEALEKNQSLEAHIQEVSLEKDALLKEIQSAQDELAKTKEQLAETIGAMNAYKEQCSLFQSWIDAKDTPSNKTN